MGCVSMIKSDSNYRLVKITKLPCLFSIAMLLMGGEAAAAPVLGPGNYAVSCAAYAIRDSTGMIQSPTGPTCNAYSYDRDATTDPSTGDVIWNEGEASSKVDLRTGSIHLLSGVSSPHYASGTSGGFMEGLTIFSSASYESPVEALFRFHISGMVGSYGSASFSAHITPIDSSTFEGPRGVGGQWHDPIFGWPNDGPLPAVFELRQTMVSPQADFILQMEAGTLRNAAFGSTFRTEVILPPGVTMTSTSGYFLQGLPPLAPVPLPASATLLLAGTGIFAVLRRQKSRRGLASV